MNLRFMRLWFDSLVGIEDWEAYKNSGENLLLCNVHNREDHMAELDDVGPLQIELVINAYRWTAAIKNETESQVPQVAADELVGGIARKACKRYRAEEKIGIILADLRGE